MVFKKAPNDNWPLIILHQSYSLPFPFNFQFKLKIEKRSRQFFFTFSYSQTSSLGLRLRGLPVENEILAITLAQMMALKRNLAQVKNSSSLTFLSIFFFVNTMSRDQFPKNRKLLTNWWPVEKQLSNNTFLIYIKYF